MRKTKKLLSALLLSFLAIGGLNACGENNTSNSSVAVQNVHTDGQGAPLDSFGNDGDTYKDTLTNNEYIKVNGHWLLVGNSNPQTLTGEGAPNDALGNNGDSYTDTTNGNFYQKQNGKWVLVKEGDKKVTHTVTFDLNGGEMPDGSITIPAQTVKSGEFVSKPQDPIKRNSSFAGWFDENNKWSFSRPVYYDLVLVARYTVNENERVTFTVDPNNGEDTYIIESFAGDTPRIAIPSKEGHNFVGWFFSDTNARFTGSVSEEMNGRTIVAKFEQSTFNLKYQIENDNTVTITGLLNIDEVNAVIPSTIDGYEVRAIGEKAFQNRISLSSVTIPSTVRDIHTEAFKGARMLSTINVDSTNPYFKSVDGVLYSKDMKVLRLCPPKNKPHAKFTIPESVEVIGDYSFYGHKDGGVSDVSFNEGLKEIGVRAFYENFLLKTLRFPSTLRKIGTGAFNCISEGNIQNVYFNDGLEVIGEMAFVGAYFKDALRLPSSVKEIGANAFGNCTAITKFTFPKSLEVLGDNAFGGAAGILEIDIEAGNTHFAVNDNILYTKDMKKVVMCPSGRRDAVTIPEGVEEIGNYAFYMVDGCQVYNMPSTLTTIGKEAFSNCYGLREFTIPDSVKSLGNNCFDACKSLKTINIGAGLREIPDQAFIECFQLTNLDIPSTIEKIGKQAFLGCTEITSLNLKEGLREIDNGAFKFGTTEENLNDNPGLTSLSIPDSVERLGDFAFENQTALTTVTIGAGLKEIGDGVFYGSSINSLTVSSSNPYFTAENKILYSKDKQTLFMALTTLQGTEESPVILPEGLKTINSYAFEKCTKITALEFPESLETIKEGAFISTRIKNVKFKSGLRTIEDGAFSRGFISTLTFSEGLETIGDSAFSTIDIKEVKLPNSLKSLGEAAFQTCTQLSSIDLGTGLEEIGNNAFYKCKKIEGTVKFPSTLKTLGTGLFVQNVSISDFDFTGNPNFVCESGVVMDTNKTTVYAFAPNSSTTSISLPSSVKEIKDYAFVDAQKVTSLTLPNGLKTINSYAFANMIRVSNLIIPSTVTYIGEGAFSHWGISTQQTVTFSFSQDYALMHFDPLFLQDTKTNFKTEYNG